MIINIHTDGSYSNQDEEMGAACVFFLGSQRQEVFCRRHRCNHPHGAFTSETDAVLLALTMIFSRNLEPTQIVFNIDNAKLIECMKDAAAGRYIGLPRSVALCNESVKMWKAIMQLISGMKLYHRISIVHARSKYDPGNLKADRFAKAVRLNDKLVNGKIYIASGNEPAEGLALYEAPEEDDSCLKDLLMRAKLRQSGVLRVFVHSYFSQQKARSAMSVLIADDEGRAVFHVRPMPFFSGSEQKSVMDYLAKVIGTLSCPDRFIDIRIYNKRKGFFSIFDFYRKSRAFPVKNRINFEGNTEWQDVQTLNRMEKITKKVGTGELSAFSQIMRLKW